MDCMKREMKQWERARKARNIAVMVVLLVVAACELYAIYGPTMF